MLQIKRLASDIIGLLFPTLCNGCGEHLVDGENEICTKCLFDLPFTDYQHFHENRVAKQLWGRLNCSAAMAMLHFKKGTKVQNLIHSLKYKHQTAVGIKLGNLLGERLKISDHYSTIDLIIPVPLHPQKERTRGYNQSKFIADGIAEVLQVPVSNLHLLRNLSTSSQTKKSRYSRYENMQEVFQISNAEELKDLHILLVDDVITTGATIEACGNTLLMTSIAKLSIAAVAFAD